MKSRQTVNNHMDNNRVKPVEFERIRRITGYLVGYMDRFNDAKRQEEADRVKHEVNTEQFATSASLDVSSATMQGSGQCSAGSHVESHP